MNLENFLQAVVKEKASDLYLAVGAKPSMKVDGALVNIADELLTEDRCKSLIYQELNEVQISEFENNLELNCALFFNDIGRFRLNLYYQKNTIGAVLRRIEDKIPELAALGVPSIVERLSMVRTGLVLVVGATGSGKSTTLAAMIGNRNKYDTGHIVTIEDPIEFIHDHQSCIVSQREVGIDTHSLQDALENTLRQAPDIILIGEIRTKEAMEHAIHFSETGHLCLATLHATNTSQALERIVSFFPQGNHNQIYAELSVNLSGIVAQRLVRRKGSKGRVAVMEVLLNTPAMTAHIKDGNISEVKPLMERSGSEGMQTIDQSLFSLYQKGLISYDDAMRAADSENNLRLLIKLKEDKKDGGSSLDGVSIM
ncbi:MAG: PilT/PilU family type 4a pilus ATPase [Francisellaceae bacterium]|nr:PilT/PilU family type 4a pilus ATPase [Francisellaceae bacterium]MBT6208118.1 PilT/PilU family type 4a pilus ATPase [Francisellaceae bacterium]MBT6538696.1 PilT/PilU family type 4a pilus ATPase [Francisellaceae bacterium]